MIYKLQLVLNHVLNIAGCGVQAARCRWRGVGGKVQAARCGWQSAGGKVQAVMCIRQSSLPRCRRLESGGKICQNVSFQFIADKDRLTISFSVRVRTYKEKIK